MKCQRLSAEKLSVLPLRQEPESFEINIIYAHLAAKKAASKKQLCVGFSDKGLVIY